MGWEAWVTLGVIVAVLTALVRGWAGADVVLLGAVTLLMSLGVVTDRLPTPGEMVAGFGNPGAVTVGVLFVVAAGLTQTGAMQMLTQPMLGRPPLHRAGPGPADGPGRAALGVPQQHAHRGDARPGRQRLVSQDRRVAVQAADPAELRRHRRGYVHAHRHVHEPAGLRAAARRRAEHRAVHGRGGSGPRSRWSCWATTSRSGGGYCRTASRRSASPTTRGGTRSR